MLKVFLVEDEIATRESLRDNIPWEEYGYEFVGEASDGEMALPLIRNTEPDVLITDIRMPFMDGLALSHIVREDFPDIKILIISGYADFDYARRALQEGVTDYLEKPITRNKLRTALEEVRGRIESEQEQRSFMEKYQNERHEYEQFFLRDFFEKVFAGKIPVEKMYEEAQRLKLDIHASSYNLLLFQVQEKDKDQRSNQDRCQRCQEELMIYLYRFSCYLVFRWSINTYGVLILGDKTMTVERTGSAVREIERICSSYGNELDWYVAAGEAVERFSMLSECYRGVSHLFSYRYFAGNHHVLNEESVRELGGTGEEGSLQSVNVAMVKPVVLQGFLEKGRSEEIGEFTEYYIESVKDGLKSRMFRDYLVLNMRFAVLNYISSLGMDQDQFLRELSTDQLQEVVAGNIPTYMTELLTHALEYRDRENDTKGRRGLKRALEYIDSNYMLEDLSLTMVAEATDFSPNYFSAVFSQEMNVTFIEYVTEKRMEHAKELLRDTGLRSSEIAGKVGYHDPHYFSFVFKRTQGCTPREYRSQFGK